MARNRSSEAPGSVHTAMDVNRDGDAFVSYYHHAPNGTNDRRVVAIIEARPTPPVIVDDEPTGGGAVGDYMELAAFPGGAYAVWLGRSANTISVVGARVAVTA